MRRLKGKGIVCAAVLWLGDGRHAKDDARHMMVQPIHKLPVQLIVPMQYKFGSSKAVLIRKVQGPIHDMLFFRSGYATPDNIVLALHVVRDVRQKDPRGVPPQNAMLNVPLGVGEPERGARRSRLAEQWATELAKASVVALPHIGDARQVTVSLADLP